MKNTRPASNPIHRFVGSAAAFVAAIWLCAVPSSAAQADVLIVIDKASQRMTVEVDGETRWVWRVSTGRHGYETPVGNFRPFRLEKEHYSREWDDAPMPYSIFFTDGGHAIHGSYDTRRLGRRASHGCVRLSPKNAARLFRLVKREGLSNARVVILPDPNAPIMAKKKTPLPLRQARKAAPIPAAPSVAVTAPVPVEAGAFSTPAEQAFGYAPIDPVALPSAEVPGAAGSAAIQGLAPVQEMN